jgi:DNA-binding MarR family transcriptional regulator
VTVTKLNPDLDGLLELLEEGRDSPTELRVLLELVDRHDATITELAKALDAPVPDLRPATRRLANRGLLRAWHEPRNEQTLFSLTPAGLARTGRVALAA